MKKKSNLLIIGLLILILMPLNCRALIIDKADYAHYDYVIDDYDVYIKVKENNTLDITETINTVFNKEKHGIIRNIPLLNQITRQDGTKDKKRAQVTNVWVNKDYKVKRSNETYQIQIGSANSYANEHEVYTIKYTYNLGKDSLKSYDEFYFNIIGDGWDTAIGKVTFTIEMPKDFDVSKLGFTLGVLGNVNNSAISYQVTGTTIKGSYDKVLGKGEALTVRCVLPDGYFIKAALKLDWYILFQYCYLLMPIILLGIAYLFYNKFGQEELVVDTVEFYPPESLNSLEMSFIYKGYSEVKDVVSLLVYLANKGYIKIIIPPTDFKKVNLSLANQTHAEQKILDLKNKIEYEIKNNPNSSKIKYYNNLLNVYQDIDTPVDYEKYNVDPELRNNGHSKERFIIQKLKEYDGTNEYEKAFMNGLFEGASETTDVKLRDRFYLVVNRILRRINSPSNKRKLFSKTSFWKKCFILLLIFLTYGLIVIPPMITYAERTDWSFPVLVIGLILVADIFLVFMKEYGDNTEGLSLFLVFILTPIALLVWRYMVWPSLIKSVLFIILNIMGIIVIVVMICLIANISRFSKKGNRIYGKILGFRNFLEVAEKDKLQKMVEENPNYFYDILPYTYVLDISNKWIKEFETIAFKTPDWYQNNSISNLTEFSNSLNSTVNWATNVMTYEPMNNSSRDNSGNSSSSSSGSSTGGGIAGGGMGGGGGSSW